MARPIIVIDNGNDNMITKTTKRVKGAQRGGLQQAASVRRLKKTIRPFKPGASGNDPDYTV